MDRKRLEEILKKLKNVRMVVFGDFFLDSYQIMDRKLSEMSIETCLEAFQVVAVRQQPGAAGTVVANLCSLGVNVLALGLTGDDGNGYVMRRKLEAMGVDLRGMVELTGYDTPTYTKPMMRELDGYEHELNRMDIKHRVPLTREIEDALIHQLHALLPEADGMLIIDQVQERNCGVITDRIRQEISQLALKYPEKIISADSREYLELFENVILKSNVRESLRAAHMESSEGEAPAAAAERCARVLTARTHRPVIITLGNNGLFLAERAGTPGCALPPIPVSGPIDIVGAGDSVNAAVGSALCAGATLKEAGILGNLAASVVIQQIGTTGCATPQQLLAQFDAHPELIHL